MGLGSSWPESVRTFLFSGLVTLLLLGFLIYVIRRPQFKKLGIVASACVIGGGLSNLIDRIVNDGAVIDFLNLGLGSLRTGIFNVADMLILLGLGLLLWQDIRQKLLWKSEGDSSD